MTSSELLILSYGSVVRRRWLGPIVALLLFLIIVYAVKGFTTIFEDAAPKTLSIAYRALVLAALLSIPGILIVRWLDRFEPKPWAIYLLCLLWGGVVATGIAVPLNAAGNLILAGIIEELAKALGLVALLLTCRAAFEGPRDGLILGALIGLGFNGLEFGEYIANGFVATGHAPWSAQIASRFALVGLSGHALYTGITGLFIGFGMLHPNAVARVGLALLGVTLAIIFHLAWDTIGVIVGAAMLGLATEGTFGAGNSATAADLPFWLLWLSSLGQILVVGFVPLLIVAIGLLRSAKWERNTMASALMDERGTSSVTEQEYAGITDTGRFPAGGASRAIFRQQFALAKRKSFIERHGLGLDEDPIVEAHKAAIIRLRKALA